MLSRRWSGYSRTGTLAGWLLALLYLVHAGLTTALARTDRALPLREELRGWHYVVGTLLFVTALVRLRAWLSERPAPPPGLPASAFAWGRALAFVAFLLMLFAPLLGLLYAWSDDLPVHLGPVTLPALVGRDRALWQATGYFHSGLGFMLVVLNLATLLTAALTSLRFRHGLLSAFPPGHGAFAFLGFSSTVYAFATFRSPEPGPVAVAVFWALAAGWALLAWAVHRNRPPVPRSRTVSPFARGLAAAGAVALLSFGAWGPYGMFRVTPFAAPADVAAVDGVEWHTKPAVTELAIRPADDFERQVEAETFKWCTFCHNMQPGGGQHKVGPNLYNIMGQRAGTVPGFGYSDAMRRARESGLVWTEETLAAYIADPQAWMPGTSMIVSSGPIPDPKVQAAVVNLLKRATAPAD
ncbi:cytochrome b/b6 domain-containing protein [Thermaurantiacus sp.]